MQQRFGVAIAAILLVSACASQEAALPPAPAGAADAITEDACGSADAALPERLSAWMAAVPAPASGLSAGRAYDLTLQDGGRVSFAAPPEKPPGEGSYAGVFALHVADDGTYEVNLGTRGWIDVVKDGAVVPSRAHGRRPACSDIHKWVAFELAAGDYVMQVSGNPEPAARLLIVPAD